VRVHFVAPCVAATGNRTTAHRIHQALTQRGLCVYRWSSACEEDVKQLQHEADEGKVDVLMGLHAYRAGSIIHDIQHRHASIPSIIILGGTDVNEMVERDRSERSTIIQTLQRAGTIICFTEAMERRVKQLWKEIQQIKDDAMEGECNTTISSMEGSESTPNRVKCIVTNGNDPYHLPRLRLIPQAVCLPPLPPSIPLDQPLPPNSCACRQPFCVRAQLGISPSHYLFILACTLREVKDPFYLVPTFERWYQKRKDVHLVIVGSLTEERYRSMAMRYQHAHRRLGLQQHSQEEERGQCSTSDASTVAASASHDESNALPLLLPPLTHYTGVSWVDSLPHSRGLLPSVRCSSCLLNSSRSEGMAAAILEAMALGVPVIVRRNEGNDSIVNHGWNGMTFETAEECIALSQRICDEWYPTSALSPPRSDACGSTSTAAANLSATGTNSSAPRHSATSPSCSSCSSTNPISNTTNDIKLCVPCMVSASTSLIARNHSVELEGKQYDEIIHAVWERELKRRGVQSASINSDHAVDST